MPRRKIIFRAGCYYHLYNRGNNHQNIFFERENYLYFLRLIRHYLIRDTVDVLAYCLMPNHYHLLVFLKAGSLSEAMKRLSLAYTKAINERYKRDGSLFQGRFKAKLIDRENYLLNLVRYIHLNPVKAGFVPQLEDWEFSSFQEYAGLRRGTLPNIEKIHGQITSENAHQAFLYDHQVFIDADFRTLLLDE